MVRVLALLDENLLIENPAFELILVQNPVT